MLRIDKMTIATQIVAIATLVWLVCGWKSFQNAESTSVVLAENQRDVYTIGKSRLLREIWRQKRRPECDLPNACLLESSYCENGGQCYFNEEECLNWCECEVGFTGQLCESPGTDVQSLCAITPRNDTDCHCMHGQCQYVSSDWNNLASVICDCDPGWVGEDCSLCCPKECTHDVCRNAADGITKCVCNDTSESYSGDFCEMPHGRHTTAMAATRTCDKVHRPSNGCEQFPGGEPPLPCQNGICIQETAGTGAPRCLCDRGWVGEYCDLCCPKHCGDNGTCHLGDDDDMRCVCEWGYTGEHCELESDRGTCMMIQGPRYPLATN